MENKGLFYCLSIAAVNTLLLVSEFLPEFNTYMELVPLGGRVGAPECLVVAHPRNRDAQFC